MKGKRGEGRGEKTGEDRKKRGGERREDEGVVFSECQKCPDTSPYFRDVLY